MSDESLATIKATKYSVKALYFCNYKDNNLYFCIWCRITDTV